MLRTLLTTSALMLLLTPSVYADTPMTFDVAEDHTRIFMAAAPLHDNGMPAHGNAFVSQGYIYPAGTLEASTTGVNDDGSPAFPDLVLGAWTCDGYFVGEGANATTGVWVISRQVFDFADGDMIITQGTELVDTGVENLRPITGASGDYAGLDGGVYQTLLGFNDHMAVNATFRIEDQEADHASLAPDYETGEWDSGAPVGPVPSI